MDAEIKAEWVRRLRSGKYKKGTMVTYNPARDTYCTLGVLDTVLKERWDAGDAVSCYWHNHFGNEVMTPIVDMNDFQEKSFDEIADWIEANV